MKPRLSGLPAAALAVLALTSCSGPRGRLMSDSDQDYVGSRTAGTAVFDRLIEGAVQRLLRLHSASNRGVGRLKVASLGVENASGEELGDWQEQIYELIDTSINRSERYRTVSSRFVNEVLRETRLRPDQLVIPKYRREFMAALETKGMPLDMLLYPKLTRGTTRAGDDVTQRNYMLTLELMDLKTGWNDKVSERLRKEYRR